MEADGGVGAADFAGAPRWAVRIRRAGGGILGAGILLRPDRVLTCAHVVAERGDYLAEFVAAPGDEVPAIAAKVIEDSYVPETRDADNDPSGDVALLRLARPRPEVETVSLHRLSAPNRDVQIYGFPRGYNGGIRLRGTIIGGIGRDGQVQLGARTPSELARPGCSGAGVVDVATGHVIGMLLSTAGERQGGFSFMSPAETIVRHLPGLSDWTTGKTAVDEGLRSGDGADGTDGEGRSLLDEAFAQRLAAWFNGGEGQVKVSLVPHTDRRRSATLRRAITLADRELRTPASTHRASLDPPDTVPQAGGHDLAVDAAGLSAREFAERIADRTGLGEDPATPAAERIRTGGKPLTLVVVGVDEAADPGELLSLLSMLRAQGNRLLLVFRAANDLFAQAQTELVYRPVLERFQHLMARLDIATGEPADHFLEQSRVVRADVSPATRSLGRAYAAKEFLSGVVPEVSVLLGLGPDLSRYERTAETAIARLAAANAQLDTLVARHTELTGRLDGYHALFQSSPRAADKGKGKEARAEESLREARLFRAAHELLDERPCDVDAAGVAVRRHLDYVESHINRAAGQGGSPSS